MDELDEAIEECMAAQRAANEAPGGPYGEAAVPVAEAAERVAAVCRRLDEDASAATWERVALRWRHFAGSGRV